MRPIILYIASSLDGFIAREKGEIDWLPTQGEFGYNEFLASVDTIIMGRKTYALCLSFPEWHYTGKKCYVLTRNTKKMKPDARVEFISDGIALAKRLQRQKSKKNIWILGGGQVVGLFLNAHLIDELRVFVVPKLIGKGIPLFQGIKKDISLQLMKTHAFPEGLVEMRYSLARKSRI